MLNSTTSAQLSQFNSRMKATLELMRRDQVRTTSMIAILFFIVAVGLSLRQTPYAENLFLFRSGGDKYVLRRRRKLLGQVLLILSILPWDWGCLSILSPEILGTGFLNDEQRAGKTLSRPAPRISTAMTNPQYFLGIELSKQPQSKWQDRQNQ